MEENKKKILMVVVIVVCLAVAGLMFVSNRKGGSGVGTLSDEAQTWVLCRNPDCEAASQMGLKAYFKTVAENAEAGGMTVPGVPCEQCGEKSVYRAVKCEKCGETYEIGSAGAQDFQDRCLDCGFSSIEEQRKNRKR